MECVGGERLGNQNAASGCASSGERWAGVISVVVVGRRNQQSRGRSAEAAPMAAWCDWLEENNSHWSGRGRAAGGWRQLVTSTASCSDLECTTASPCKPRVNKDLHRCRSGPLGFMWCGGGVSILVRPRGGWWLSVSLASVQSGWWLRYALC